MNTKQLSALGTDPLFLFGSNEMSYAEFPYVFEIVNHAHSIPGAITPIQVVQPVARIAVTDEAELDAALHTLLTVLDSAHDAGY